MVTALLVCPWAYVVHKRLLVREAAEEAADLQLHPARPPMEGEPGAVDDGGRRGGAAATEPEVEDAALVGGTAFDGGGDPLRESVDITDFGDGFDPRAEAAAPTQAPEPAADPYAAYRSEGITAAGGDSPREGGEENPVAAADGTGAVIGAGPK